MPSNGASPYRNANRAEGQTGRRGPLTDVDVLVPLAVLWPAFLAVVIHTVVRGETFGAGTTLCAGIVLLVPALWVSAWHARSRP